MILAKDGHLHLHGETVNAAIRDVGMQLSPCTLKSLNRIEKIQPRMMGAMFNGNLCTTIISCNSSTNASDEKDLDTFYNELSSLVCGIPKHNVFIRGGDMNAQIGKNENTFSQYNSSHRNGEFLTDFSLENGLTCFNTTLTQIILKYK